MSKIRAVTKVMFSILAFASIVMMAACVIVGIVKYRLRPERNTASIWSHGSTAGYAHVAAYAKGARAYGEGSPLAYTDDGSSLSVDDIERIRASLQGVIDQASRPKRGAKDQTVKTYNWTDCYCSCLKGMVNTGIRGTGELHEADIYAVSGSFTALHPVEFLAGGFLSSDTTDKYQVVLNDAASWSMFRSYDVLGKRLNILGEDYTITGVIREHEDNDARVYIPFERLEEFCSKLETPVTPAVMSYEAIIPEISSKSAHFDLSGAIPGYNISSPSYRVVRVTGRYNVFNILKSKNMDGFELPFWEEGALKAESEIKTAAIVFAFGLVILAGLVIGKISFSSPRTRQP